LGVQFSCGQCYCATRISSCLALIVLALSPIVNLQLLVWWVLSDASWSYRVGRLGGRNAVLQTVETLRREGIPLPSQCYWLNGTGVDCELRDAIREEWSETQSLFCSHPRGELVSCLEL